MGRDVTYRRRKQSAECFNPDNLERVINMTYCDCTNEDWECDVEYERQTDGSCKLIGAEPKYPPSHCPAGTAYNKTVGFRPVAGTYCQQGVQRWGEGPFTCPEATLPPSAKGWIVAVIVVPIVLLVLVGAAVAVRSEKVREKLPFLKCLNHWKIGYFGMQSRPDTLMDETDEDYTLDNDTSVISDSENLRQRSSDEITSIKLDDDEDKE